MCARRLHSRTRPRRTRTTARRLALPLGVGPLCRHPQANAAQVVRCRSSVGDVLVELVASQQDSLRSQEGRLRTAADRRDAHALPSFRLSVPGSTTVGCHPLTVSQHNSREFDEHRGLTHLLQRTAEEGLACQASPLPSALQLLWVAHCQLEIRAAAPRQCEGAGVRTRVRQRRYSRGGWYQPCVWHPLHGPAWRAFVTNPSESKRALSRAARPQKTPLLAKAPEPAALLWVSRQHYQVPRREVRTGTADQRVVRTSAG